MIGRRIRADIGGWCFLLGIMGAFLAALLTTARVEAMTMDVVDGDDQCVVITASKGNTINANFEIVGSRAKGTMVIFRRSSDNQLLYRKKDLQEDLFRVDATANGEYELCFINGDNTLMNELGHKDVPKDPSLVGLDALRREKKDKEQTPEQKKGGESDSAADQDDDDSTLSDLFLTDEEDDPSGDDDDYDVDYYGRNAGYKTFGFGLRLGKDVEDLESQADVASADMDRANFLKDEADVLVQILSIFNDHESFMRGREQSHRADVEETSKRLMWCTIIEAAVLVWVSWSQLSYIRRFFETKRVL